MPDWLHRTTLQHLTSVASADLAEAEANYIEEPDLSSVTGQPVRYWTVTGDVVSLKSVAEQQTVDDALLSDTRDQTADQLDPVEDIIRAFALVVLDEINILRAREGLANRTIAQLKNGVRAKLGS